MYNAHCQNTLEALSICKLGPCLSRIKDMVIKRDSFTKTIVIRIGWEGSPEPPK